MEGEKNGESFNSSATNSDPVILYFDPLIWTGFFMSKWWNFPAVAGSDVDVPNSY